MTQDIVVFMRGIGMPVMVVRIVIEGCKDGSEDTAYALAFQEKTNETTEPP